MARYPDDVRFVYRHMPLDRIHERARVAAEASLCAHDQDQFWAYHDLLFANPKALGDEDLKRFAEELNLDVAAWEQCMAEGKFADARSTRTSRRRVRSASPARRPSSSTA